MTFSCHFWNKYPNNNKISMNSQKSLKIRPNMTRIYQKPSKSCSFVRNSLDIAIFSLKTPKMIKTMLENNFFREKIWLGGTPWGTTYGVPPPPCCRTLQLTHSSYSMVQLQHIPCTVESKNCCFFSESVEFEPILAVKMIVIILNFG